MTIEKTGQNPENYFLDTVKKKAEFLINYGSATGRNSILSVGLLMFLSVAGFEVSQISINKLKNFISKK